MSAVIVFQVNPDRDYSEQWNELMSRKCKCGHPLSAHAFSVGWYMDFNRHHLYVSQCCFCGITEGKFDCEGFKEE